MPVDDPPIATPYAMARAALAGKPWGYKIGTLRMWQQYGQAYAEMFKGSLTAGGIVGVIAMWMGVTSKPAIVAIGVGSVLFWQVFATFAGYLAWRYKVIHHMLGADWHNNPYQVRMLAAMEETAAALWVLTEREETE